MLVLMCHLEAVMILCSFISHRELAGSLEAGLFVQLQDG